MIRLDLGARPAARYAEAILTAATVFSNGRWGALTSAVRAANPVVRRRPSLRRPRDRRRGREPSTRRQFGLEGAAGEGRVYDREDQAVFEFLEGRELPGVEVLRRTARARVQGADGRGPERNGPAAPPTRAPGPSGRG